jgi:hypothetical protein
LLRTKQSFIEQLCVTVAADHIMTWSLLRTGHLQKFSVVCAAG